MSHRTRSRLLGGAAGLLAAALMGTAVAAPASAYIDSCDDPIVAKTVVERTKNGSKVTRVVFVNTVSGKPLSEWAKNRILTPDAGKETDGTFTVPVPDRFQGKPTRVTVQLVDSNRQAPQWMAQSPTFRPWGGGHQVWLRTTMTPGTTVDVGIPNFDPVFDLSDFKFEVTYSTRVDGKRVQDSYLVVPKNQISFAQYEDQSNGLTSLTVG